MGGYAGERLSGAASDAMEVNAWAFADATTGRSHELFAIDALYAGDLVAMTTRPDCQRLFAASHTHCGPMLDSSKPQLGALSHAALKGYAEAVNDGVRSDVTPDVCRVYRAEVDVPVYRRFDVPDSTLNRWLAGHAGMYPNEAQTIDRQIYVIEFAQGEQCLFTLVYHACHPVTRGDSLELSPDYVGALRAAVRQRFGARACLFLQGCAGDIRPNFANKRVTWLPRGRLNWRFTWPVTPAIREMTDRRYAQAVQQATLSASLALAPASAVRVEHRTLALRAQGVIDIPCLVIGGSLRLEFLPFEVSHHFHLDAQDKDPMRFIVSCANHTLGYLPHPRQLAAGGYEVDGSRSCMGLAARVELAEGATW